MEQKHGKRSAADGLTLSGCRRESGGMESGSIFNATYFLFGIVGGHSSWGHAPLLQ